MTHWYKYQEGRGEWAKELDPILAENPLYQGQEAYRVVAELLKYAYPLLPTLNERQQERLMTCIGCDCAHITQALGGNPPRMGYDRVQGHRKCGELRDVAILIQFGETRLYPLYQQVDGPEIHPDDLSALEMGVAYDMDEDDHLIVCRQFEPNIGHGMKWLRISRDQGLELHDEWNQWQEEDYDG